MSSSNGHQTIEVDNDWLSNFMLVSYPFIIAQGLIMMECIRILPAEIRMVMRIIKRKRPNAAEVLFFTIKYFAIIGYVGNAVVRDTKYPKTILQCKMVDTVGYVFTFLSTSAVAATIAWRCYIIFQCRRRVYWMLIIALAIQISLSVWTAKSQLAVSVNL